MSASLGLDDVMEKARICCGLAAAAAAAVVALLAERAAALNTKGATWLAMVVCVLFNGKENFVKRLALLPDYADTQCRQTLLELPGRPCWSRKLLT